MNSHVPPTIIAFASSKGGAGKTTACLNIAGALAARSAKVHVLDFDPNQTLLRWHETHQPAQAISNLTVEAGPHDPTVIKTFMRDTWFNRTGYVLIDLPGNLTQDMLKLGAFAALTITPAKLSEPDISEAIKLSKQLNAIATSADSDMVHRILLNEVEHLLSGGEVHSQAIVDKHPSIKRFETIIHRRPIYKEVYMAGLPPHLSDTSRPPIQKAVWEIDDLMREINALLSTNEQRAAA